MTPEWQIISPEIAILATAVIILIIDLFVSKHRSLVITGVSFIGVIVALLLAFANSPIMKTGFNNSVASDPIGFYFKIIFCLGTLLTIFISSTYVNRELKSTGEYYFLVFIATFGMMVMATSLDLITIFLGLEVMSIPLYVLAGIHRDRPRSREAAMKYFLLGAFSSGFLLYGITLIFGAYGTTNLITLSQRFEFGYAYSEILSLAGLVLVLIGIGFKVGMAPFHMWIPDVYEGAPAPVTAFMSAGPKAAGFAALFRIVTLYAPTVSDNFTTILWILAAVTMTWGNILAISQQNIKRMLAYSSIAHAGYILVALTAGGANGISAGIFYLLVYTLMNIGAFAIIVLLAGKGEKFDNIKDYAGLGIKYPFAGFAMTIFMLSLSGIPATAGFIGKYKIFISAIDSGFVWLAIIGIINSLISVWYYFGVIVTMFMKPETDAKIEMTMSPSLMIVILVSVIGILALGLFPRDWINLSDLAGQFLNSDVLNRTIMK